MSLIWKINRHVSPYQSFLTHFVSSCYLYSPSIWIAYVALNYCSMAEYLWAWKNPAVFQYLCHWPCCWMFLLLDFQLHSLLHSVHSASHFLAPNSLLCPLTFFTSVMSFICFSATTRNHLWQHIDVSMYNMWRLPLLLKQLFLLFCLYPFYIKATVALELWPHIFTVTMIPG